VRVSVLWVAFTLIFFCLPELNLVNSKTLNHTPIIVGAVLRIFGYALAFWAISPRTLFLGPA
jgi:hypothetical protein